MRNAASSSSVVLPFFGILNWFRMFLIGDLVIILPNVVPEPIDASVKNMHPCHIHLDACLKTRPKSHVTGSQPSSRQLKVMGSYKNMYIPIYH